MIVLEDVVKKYRLGKSEVKALRGVDLTVESGEFVSICGPSGSGKSTLLNLMGCIDVPTSGRVMIDGVDISSLTDAELAGMRNRSIGFIFQSFNLIPVFTSFENVEYPLVLMGKGKKERKKKVEQVLDGVGLAEFQKHKPDNLSGGQRQRVAIARALVTEPQLVLADEPTANLDSVTGLEILALMKKINREQNTTFVFSTHDEKVMKYAARVYDIVDGRIAE